IQNNFCCVSVAYAFTKVYSLSLHDALPISNRATSRLNSRSSVRPTGSPPIPIHTRARAPGPAGPPAPAPPPSTALLLPWLQFLKGWSLLQTRGDSTNRAPVPLTAPPPPADPVRPFLPAISADKALLSTRRSRRGGFRRWRGARPHSGRTGSRAGCRYPAAASCR